MFRTMEKTRGMLTLFHSPASQTSKNVLRMVRTAFPNVAHRDFDIEVLETNPTEEQVETMHKFGLQDSKTRPILVDWFNGKVAVDESIAKQILDELKAKQSNPQGETD
ncbi:hypothetical protein TRVA0_056S00408 [Trichomonascus vanleenenianus]|uniref:uncharacterized protein n=1 Tax=Trichomonascus vanleenenianus TaxID=2268995 RepID=UPI003ECB5C90